MRARFLKGSILRLEGPAFMQVVEGSVSIFGKVMKPKETFIVPKAKSFPIEVNEDSTLELKLGEGAKIENLEELTTPLEWKEAVERICSLRGPTVAIVLGGVDSGKSTFCIYLVNQAVAKGLRTAIIDKDPGQSDVGPPTTVSLGFIEKPVGALSEVKLADAYFVGATSPSWVMERVICGVSLLLSEAFKRGAELIVINTSGWIAGKGARELKLNIAAITQPDVIIAIERRGELEHLLKPLKGLTKPEIIRIPCSKSIRVRTREDRKMIREAAYGRFLKEAKVRSISIDEVGLSYSFLGSGFQPSKEALREIEEMVEAPLVYCEESEDSLLIIVGKDSNTKPGVAELLKERFGKQEVRILPEGFERNLIVGLRSPEGKFLGIGIIREINYRKRFIQLITKVDEEVRLIEVGQMKIGEDGKELGIIDKWSL